MERMEKPKFIKEIEKSEWKERAKCWRWYIRVYWELDHNPMVELESLEIVVKELHKVEEENRKLKERIDELEKCNLNLQERLDRKEEVNKKMREELSKKNMETWFNEKAKNIFTEEGTLQ